MQIEPLFIDLLGPHEGGPRAGCRLWLLDGLHSGSFPLRTLRPPPSSPMLPISTSPQATDVAVCGWAGITIRIAWELMARGARVRPQVLRDARDHVLFHLPPTMMVAHAEDRAATLAREFVDRARQVPVRGTWVQDGTMPLSPRWRRALEQSLTPLSEVILRYHYADGHSLPQLERMLGTDGLTLEAARGGLREVVRHAASEDGLPIGTWSPERLDGLVSRLAAFSLGPCPPLHEILDGLHDVHLRRCARCDRANRLLSAGVLSTSDLKAPRLGARPNQSVDIYAVHFHPEGRQFRNALVAEATMPLFPVDDDMLLLDADREDEVRALLVLAAEVGSPPRDMIRVARLSGAGRWSRHGLLGPLGQQARDVVLSRSWGSVEGLGELPGPLPEPPSARRAWGVAAVSVALSAASVASMARPASSAGELDAAFTPARQGVWATFDVPEDRRLLLVARDEQGLRVVHRSDTAADKAALATGDGSYRLHAQGSGLVVAAMASDWPDLTQILEDAAGSNEPIEALARRLSLDLEADVMSWGN